MLRTICCFLLGMYEFRSDFTTAFTRYYDAEDGPNDQAYDLQLAYDWGREWAHRLTFRYFDQQ